MTRKLFFNGGKLDQPLVLQLNFTPHNDESDEAASFLIWFSLENYVLSLTVFAIDHSYEGKSIKFEFGKTEMMIIKARQKHRKCLNRHTIGK